MPPGLEVMPTGTNAARSQPEHLAQAEVRRRTTRLYRLRLIVAFAWARGHSLQDRIRLAYYAGFKPAFAARGLTTYSRERLLQFKLRARARNCITVLARDCGDDIGTIVEFFSRLRQLVPPDLPALEPRVVYDIGAHIGIASLFLATYYPSARFYGFEPLPSNYNICRLNYEGLPASRAFPWAISSASGTRAFRFGEGDLRGGCLAGGAPPLSTSLRDQVQVQVRSVHDLVATDKLDPPEFLKIDVEGAEFEVLTGLGVGERSVRRIWLETHGPEVRAKCLEWLCAHGFAIHNLGEDRPGCGLVWGDRA